MAATWQFKDYEFKYDINRKTFDILRSLIPEDHPGYFCHKGKSDIDKYGFHLMVYGMIGINSGKWKPISDKGNRPLDSILYDIQLWDKYDSGIELVSYDPDDISGTITLRTHIFEREDI